LKQTISLQKSFARKLVAFGSILVVSMMAIVAIGYTYGFDYVAVVLTRMDARTLAVRLESENSGQEVLNVSTSTVFRSWQELPADVRKAYVSPQQLELDVPVDDLVERQGQHIYLSLMKFLLDNGKTAFWLAEFRGEEADRVYREYLKVITIAALIGIALFMLLLFILAARWMKSLEQPFVHLTRWAEKMGTDYQQEKAQYEYQELNEIAEQLESAIERITAYNQRESQFLRNASHELRTPLAIMQASLDTLSEQHGSSRPLGRAQHAVENMSTLCRTLLWLARESADELESEQLDLADICLNLSQRLSYLKRNKQLCFKLSGEGSCLANPALAEIVISNLIRNAYQYAEEGTINVRLYGSYIALDNVSHYQGKHASGFGLGLELVKRICDRHNWYFRYRAEGGKVIVEVNFAEDSKLSETSSVSTPAKDFQK